MSFSSEHKSPRLKIVVMLDALAEARDEITARH